MITITCTKWSRTAHAGRQKEEQDWTVSLNGVQLAVYSTYSTDCYPQGDPQLRAAAFARSLLSAVAPILENARALIDYREGSTPYNEAARALQLCLDQLDMEK